MNTKSREEKKNELLKPGWLGELMRTLWEKIVTTILIIAIQLFQNMIIKILDILLSLFYST